VCVRGRLREGRRASSIQIGREGGGFPTSIFNEPRRHEHFLFLGRREGGRDPETMKRESPSCHEKKKVKPVRRVGLPFGTENEGEAGPTGREMGGGYSRS